MAYAYPGPMESVEHADRCIHTVIDSWTWILDFRSTSEFIYSNDSWICNSWHLPISTTLFARDPIACFGPETFVGTCAQQRFPTWFPPE
jgi:hypothetical protein